VLRVDDRLLFGRGERFASLAERVFAVGLGEDPSQLADGDLAVDVRGVHRCTSSSSTDSGMRIARPTRMCGMALRRQTL